MKHLSFSLKALLIIGMAFFFGGYVAVAAEIPQYALAFGTGAALFTLLPKGLQQAGVFNVIAIGDIIAEYGNYYRAGSQSVKDLKIALMQKSETESFFTSRLTAATRLELGNASITRVLQAYQHGFTPIGDTTFKPQVIELDHMKIDVKILPAELMDSWLGYLAENGLVPKDCPIVKFWLEKLVIPKFQEDLELNEIFSGKKTTVVADTPSATGTTMNGVKEKLKAAGINTVTMGIVPPDPILFVKYVEDFFGNIPEIVRNGCKQIAMNKTLMLRYKQGKRAKYNQYYAQDADLLKLADFDATVVGLASHAPSTVIWTSPEDNKIIGNKNPGNQTVFNLQEFNREVKGLTDFHKGVGFWSNALVYKSDVALT